jgi:hypothetical protein
VPGHNHVYSTVYDNIPPLDGIAPGVIPNGTYVAFEDLPLSNPSDWNYDDEAYDFTNVAEQPSVPEPVSLVSLVGLSAMGLTGLVWHRRRRAA